MAIRKAKTAPARAEQAQPASVDVVDDAHRAQAAEAVSTSPDPSDEGVAGRPIIWTMVICVAAAVLGHALIYLGFAFEWTEEPDPDFAWQPVVGAVLAIVALTAFGGFYLASRRARIAITSAFLLTFLVSLTFVLTIEGLAENTQKAGVSDLFDDFRNIVTVIIGFYFGTEAAISVTKVIGMSVQNRGAGSDAARAGMAADIRRADRDLAPPTRPS